MPTAKELSEKYVEDVFRANPHQTAQHVLDREHLIKNIHTRCVTAIETIEAGQETDLLEVLRRIRRLTEVGGR